PKSREAAAIRRSLRSNSIIRFAKRPWTRRWPTRSPPAIRHHLFPIPARTIPMTARKKLPDRGFCLFSFLRYAPKNIIDALQNAMRQGQSALLNRLPVGNVDNLLEFQQVD